nr:response regulator transcription factor [uncultured Holophaga sp.]
MHVVASALGATKASSPSGGPQRVGVSDPGRPSLLVIEDERVTLALLRRVLSRAGFMVLESTTGENGLSLFLAHRPALILLDIGLPGIDGLEVLRRLREQHDGVPILLLTSMDGNRDRVVGLDAGADDYVVKPFDPCELVARVRALLRRVVSQPAAREMMVSGDLRLSVLTRKCSKGVREIDLTPTEAVLLSVLMTHPEEVMSRESLMEHLWGQQCHVTGKSLDVYVHRLREKLTDEGGESPIRTVRGVGYTLR